MIDEAFMDFADENKVITLLKVYKEYSNLLIVRAFTKFFGVPGLRLGFGITCGVDLKNTINKISIPWSLNTFASYFGYVLKNDEGYIQETYKWINLEKDWFLKELRKLKNIRVFDTDVNFVLFRLETDVSASILWEKMIIKGILIRNCSSFRGLNEKYVRLAIKDRKSNEKIINALNIFL